MHFPTRQDSMPDFAQDSHAFYEATWPAYRDFQRYAPAPRYIRRMVMRELGRLEFLAVLDAGCGEGSLLGMVAARYPVAAIAGSELSETALSYCRQALPQGEFFLLDLERSDPPPRRFDVVLCVQVLEHLREDRAGLRTLRGLCGNAVVISVPGGNLDAHGRANGHYRHYTTRELAEKMREAGFEVRRIYNYGWPVHSLFYRLLVRLLPRRMVEGVGLGTYSPRKIFVMRLLDWAYRLNLSFVGTEVIAVGVPR